jgi:hypothetical protein
MDAQVRIYTSRAHSNHLTKRLVVGGLKALHRHGRLSWCDIMDVYGTLDTIDKACPCLSTLCVCLAAED